MFSTGLVDLKDSLGSGKSKITWRTCRIFLVFLMFGAGEGSSTAKLRIWTLRIWGFWGPGFRSARQVLCGDASRLSLDHFCKHLSSVLGGQSSVTRCGFPGPKNPKAKKWKILENSPQKSIFGPFFCLFCPCPAWGRFPFRFPFFSISGFWPFSMPYQPGRIPTLGSQK